MEEDAGQSARFIAAQDKIPKAVRLLERARGLLQEVGEMLPDPSEKVELERDLDPTLDVDPDEVGVVARCVSNDYLRPAIDDLKELLRSSEPGDPAALEEEAVA